MNNLMEYQDYFGTVSYSETDDILYGKVIGVNSLISYEGKSVGELKEDFHQAVDEYLALCAEEGISPEKTYKGSFNVRISPELHKSLAICSQSEGKTLNSVVEQALESYLNMWRKSPSSTVM